MVLAREKKEQYALYLPLSKGTFDKKGTVSKYTIISMKQKLMGGRGSGEYSTRVARAAA
jgi:hypothetical protein